MLIPFGVMDFYLNASGLGPQFGNVVTASLCSAGHDLLDVKPFVYSVENTEPALYVVEGSRPDNAEHNTHIKTPELVSNHKIASTRRAQLAASA